jgi:hypothetical protein
MGCIMSLIKFFKRKKNSIHNHYEDLDVNTNITTNITAWDTSITDDDINIIDENTPILRKDTKLSCPQCYNDFTKSELLKMICGHYYCRKCYYDTYLSNILHPDMKICAECLKPLKSAVDESITSLVMDPIPLDNTLKKCDDLINNLKYFNLDHKNLDLSQKILSISPYAFRIAILKINYHDDKKTVINLYLLPEFDSVNLQTFNLLKNNQKTFDNFSEYLFTVISQEYSIWFSDTSSFDITTGKLHILN